MLAILTTYQNYIISFVQDMNEDEVIDENMERENTQSMNIMDINSADDDDAAAIVTVKEEYQDVLI